VFGCEWRTFHDEILGGKGNGKEDKMDRLDRLDKMDKMDRLDRVF
jgi:hypothetical protein